MQAAVARIDEILDSGDDVAIQQLKESFGMGNVTYSDDFASARTFRLSQGVKLTCRSCSLHATWVLAKPQPKRRTKFAFLPVLRCA